ncbi:MAG: hypothetical protein ACRD0I_08595 [Acidimicrobiales bacterium]
MNIFVALAIGYLVGAKTGGKDLEHLSRSLKALCGTDEFSDVVSAARVQVGSTLRELATLVGGEQGAPDSDGDLVTRVRHLVGQG